MAINSHSEKVILTENSFAGKKGCKHLKVATECQTSL